MSLFGASAKFKRRLRSGIECTSARCPQAPCRLGHGLCAHPGKQTAALPGARWLQGQAGHSRENPERKPSVKPDTMQGRRDSESLSVLKALRGGIFLSTCVQPIRTAGWTHTWADWSAEPATRPERPLEILDRQDSGLRRAFLWTDIQAQTKQPVWKQPWDKTEPRPRSRPWPRQGGEEAGQHHHRCPAGQPLWAQAMQTPDSTRGSGAPDGKAAEVKNSEGNPAKTNTPFVLFFFLFKEIPSCPTYPSFRSFKKITTNRKPKSVKSCLKDVQLRAIQKVYVWLKPQGRPMLGKCSITYSSKHSFHSRYPPPVAP